MAVLIRLFLNYCMALSYQRSEYICVFVWFVRMYCLETTEMVGSSSLHAMLD